MPFSYKPLWKLLIDRNMSKEKLRTALNMSPVTIAKMGRGENVSMDVLDRICRYFDVGLDSVVEYVTEKDKE